MITQKEKYRFKKYRKSYLEIFEKEKTNLSAIPNIKIEHIGSTAVKGLGGKGIIDIMVGVKKRDMNKVSKYIIKKRFILINKEKNRWFFEKDICYPSVKRIHVQLIPLNSEMWKDAIIFRDYLVSNKKTREKYAKIKKVASKKAKGDGFSYRKHKNSLIKEILEKIR